MSVDSEPSLRASSQRRAAALIGSSDHDAFGDDARKDDDSIAFVFALERPIRRAWLQRLRWFRTADRLAEAEAIDPRSRRFTRLREGWDALCRTGQVDWRLPDAPLLRELGDALNVDGPALTPAARAWGRNLAALGDYSAPGLTLATLAEHDAMLTRLGVYLEVVPFLEGDARADIAGFGALDQFFNNLRDLAEDAASGHCFFPTETLARFGIARDDVLAGRAARQPGWRDLTAFWLDAYLPRLRAGAAAFVERRDLHPSVAAMRAACLERYARVEAVFRGCGGDPLAFAAAYWRPMRASDAG
jgi:phytoene synthase